MSYIDPVDHFIPSSQALSIRDLLETQAIRTPDAIAIAAPGRTPLTYGRLWRHIDYVAQALNAMGLGCNDRIAIVLPNGPEMAVAFLAVAAVATSAPLNPSYLASEFDFYLSDLNAKAVMIQAGIDSPTIAVAQKCGISILECIPTPEAEAGVFTLRGDTLSHLVGTDHSVHCSGFAQPDDVALVLHTSGTTSRPKLVPLTHANICTSARNIQLALKLTEQDRCLNIMPLFHIHGLIGATLSSLAAGASVVCTLGFDATMFFEWLDAFHPTWYTAVPTMHQAILPRAEVNSDIIARTSLRFIRSSSAALPPQAMAELEKTLRVPVIESYGMTEASHQMTSNPLPPQERKAGSVGVAAGPDIAIMDEAGNLLSPGQTGEIVIRGANVTQGYENNPMANHNAFVSSWFRTGDQGILDTEGYLFITGRLKEIINRGGEKISPREVDDVLMDHPFVEQVVTFAMPDVLLGEDVAAAVVLREDCTATEREIQAFAGTRLSDFKIPRRIVILKEIPKGPTGKLQRMGLAETLGLTIASTTCFRSERTYIAPRDALEHQLTQIWEKVLAIKPIGIKDNFFDLGGYSLLAVHLFNEIEHTIGVTLPLATLFQALTIEQLADILRQEVWSSLWSPLVPIQSDGSALPFFFIHAVSGNVLHYRHLSHYLGLDQPFYGLQAQGLDGKQPPHTRIEDMAALYIDEVRTLQPEGPYLLGGGSSGGVVAYEMAQQLQMQGQQVALLALFDTYFPGKLKYLPHSTFFHSRTYHFLQKVDFHVGSLLLRKPKDQLNYMYDIAFRIKTKISTNISGASSHFSPYCDNPLSKALEEVLKANRQAISNYIPQVYPGRIVLFLGCEAPERSFYDRRLGWNDMAAEGLEIHIVPGSHETLFGEPHVKVLAEKLQICLQKVA